MRSFLKAHERLAIAALATLLLVLAPEAHAFGKKKPNPVRPAVEIPADAHGSYVLRVMTYNIQGLPVPWLDHTRYADIGRELRRRRQAGTAPHVVAIQEAFYNRVEEMVEAAGYPYLYAGPNGDWPRFGSGLIILSEFPADWRAREVYDDATSFEINTSKGVQLARLRIPGMPGGVEVLNTHLQSDPEGDPTTPLSETRRVKVLQIGQLARFFHRETEPRLPAILVGDLNVRPLDAVNHYDTMVALLGGLTNAAEYCESAGTCARGPDPGADWRTSLDHHLYRASVGGRIRLTPVYVEKGFTRPVNGRMLSDHASREVHYRVEW